LHIELNQALPLPMRDESFSPESLWKRSAILESGNDHLILAPSGTGKTSLLSFLFGMRNDYQGSILMDNKEVKTISIAEWALIRRERISIVMQDMRLIPTLTVEDNLNLKNNLKKMYRENDIRDMLSRLGLQEKWKQKAGTLSIGQQQRVSIVRSLLQPYELLMLDEPFSHIDEENIRLASELIVEQTRKKGANILMVSLGLDYNMKFNQQHRL